MINKQIVLIILTLTLIELVSAVLVDIVRPCSV